MKKVDLSNCGFYFRAPSLNAIGVNTVEQDGRGQGHRGQSAVMRLETGQTRQSLKKNLRLETGQRLEKNSRKNGGSLLFSPLKTFVFNAPIKEISNGFLIYLTRQEESELKNMNHFQDLSLLRPCKMKDMVDKFQFEDESKLAELRDMIESYIIYFTRNLINPAEDDFEIVVEGKCIIIKYGKTRPWIRRVITMIILGNGSGGDLYQRIFNNVYREEPEPISGVIAQDFSISDFFMINPDRIFPAKKINFATEESED